MPAWESPDLPPGYLRQFLGPKLHHPLVWCKCLCGSVVGVISGILQMKIPPIFVFLAVCFLSASTQFLGWPEHLFSSRCQLEPLVKEWIHWHISWAVVPGVEGNHQTKSSALSNLFWNMGNLGRVTVWKSLWKGSYFLSVWMLSVLQRYNAAV